MSAVQLSFADSAVLIVYFVLIVGLGVFAAKASKGSANQYFLAGNSLRWPMVGAALFATNISTIHLVGLAAGGFQYGLVIGNFEWMAVITIVFLALIFAPRFVGAGLSTVPEFLERRYSHRIRLIVAVINIFAALLIHIGISLFAGSQIIEALLGVPSSYSILAVALLTFIYTAMGGLKAVVWTETVQTFVLIGAAILVTVLMFRALPDYGIVSFEGLSERLRPDHLEMLQPISGESGRLNEYSWLAVLLGYPVLGIWYWCTDQTIVQRALGASSIEDAQYGALFCGFLKILPVFILVLPGILAYAVFSAEIGDDANRTYSVILAEIVPDGLRGLIVAGLLAALMSTVAGAIHSCSTTIALDLLPAIRKTTSAKTKVLVGRVATAVIIVIATAWSTQGDKFSSIFEAINKIPVAFAPPIVVVFLAGLLWRKASEKAAFVTLATGFSVGMAVLLLDLPMVGDKRVFSDVVGIPYMLQAWILFVVYALLFAIVASMSIAESEGTKSVSGDAAAMGEGIGNPKAKRLAVLLLTLLAALYWATTLI